MQYYDCTIIYLVYLFDIEKTWLGKYCTSKADQECNMYDDCKNIVRVN